MTIRFLFYKDKPLTGGVHRPAMSDEGGKFLNSTPELLKEELPRIEI